MLLDWDDKVGIEQSHFYYTLVYNRKTMRLASLWVGIPMPKLQMMCLSSFVYHGHDITLYVYDLDMTVPNGVKKADAREILPEESLFKVEDSYSAFSDIFRYTMIKKTGAAWVDADTICLSSDWNFKDNIFASYEEGAQPSVVGGVLSLDPNSKILDYLISESKKVNKETMVWAELGPNLLDKAFKEYNYMEYAYSWDVFLGIRIHDCYKLWDKRHLKEILQIEKKSKAISVYNQMLVRGGYDRNNFPAGSAISYFEKKFMR